MVTSVILPLPTLRFSELPTAFGYLVGAFEPSPNNSRGCVVVRKAAADAL